MNHDKSTEVNRKITVGGWVGGGILRKVEMRMESKLDFQRFLVRCSVGLCLSLVHTNEYGHRVGSQPPL